MEALNLRPKLVDVRPDIRTNGYAVQAWLPFLQALAKSAELGLTEKEREQFGLEIDWKSPDDGKKSYSVEYTLAGPIAKVYLKPLVEIGSDIHSLEKGLQNNIFKAAALVPENMNSMFVEAGITTWFLITAVLTMLFLNGEGVPKEEYSTIAVWAANCIASLGSLVAIDRYNHFSRNRIEKLLQERYGQSHFVNIRQISPDTIQDDE